MAPCLGISQRLHLNSQFCRSRLHRHAARGSPRVSWPRWRRRAGSSPALLRAGPGQSAGDPLGDHGADTAAKQWAGVRQAKRSEYLGDSENLAAGGMSARQTWPSRLTLVSTLDDSLWLPLVLGSEPRVEFADQLVQQQYPSTWRISFSRCSLPSPRLPFSYPPFPILFSYYLTFEKFRAICSTIGKTTSGTF